MYAFGDCLNKIVHFILSCTAQLMKKRVLNSQPSGTTVDDVTRYSMMEGVASGLSATEVFRRFLFPICFSLSGFK